MTFGGWIEEKAETLGVQEAPGTKKEGLNFRFCPKLVPCALKPSGDIEGRSTQKGVLRIRPRVTGHPRGGEEMRRELERKVGAWIRMLDLVTDEKTDFPLGCRDRAVAR